MTEASDNPRPTTPRPRRAPPQWTMRIVLAVLVVLSASTSAHAQQTPSPTASPVWSDLFPASADSTPRRSELATPRNELATPSEDPTGGLPPELQPPAPPASPSTFGIPDLTKRETFSSALQILVLLTILSLAPAIMIMMTSFTRIIIVLSLLRQALGTQQLPPNQVIIDLALFMTFLVMGPTWQRVNNEALRPYLDGQLDQKSALARAQQPVRDFMIQQIDKAGNWEDVFLFTDFVKQPQPRTWGEVGTMTLVPAFMLSELKIAFLMGFKIYLPFLIIDMVISAILISMGMMMLPPVLISLPFKLLLFVLVDGWRLITGSLLGSFVT